MTKQATKIQNTLRKNTTYEVKFICERKVSKKTYYQFVIIQFDSIRAVVTISEEEKFIPSVIPQFELWQFNNLESFFLDTLFNNVQSSIKELNKVDAE